MSNLRHIQFSEPIQPELTFVYYDRPLMFISNEVNGQRHFFYYIEDDAYFWMPLTKKYEQFLRHCHRDKNPSHDRILSILSQHKVLQIIKFETEYVADVYDIKEYEDQYGDVTDGLIYHFGCNAQLTIHLDREI